MNKKLAFRTESIRRLDSSLLKVAAGGKKAKASKNCTSDGNDAGSDTGQGDSWSNTGGSGSLNPITTLVHHID